MASSSSPLALITVVVGLLSLAAYTADAITCNVRSDLAGPGLVSQDIGSVTSSRVGSATFTACYSFNLLMYDSPSSTFTAAGPWTNTGAPGLALAATCGILALTPCYGNFSGGWPDENLFPGSSTMQGDACTLLSSKFLTNATSVSAVAARALPPANGTTRTKAYYGSMGAGGASCCSTDACNGLNKYSFNVLPPVSPSPPAPPPSPQGGSGSPPPAPLTLLLLASFLLLSLSTTLF